MIPEPARQIASVLVILIMASCLSAQQKKDNEEIFGRGEALVAANCGDCLNASREGLQEGIRLAEQAVQLGYPDKVTAYKLIASALRTMAVVYSRPDSEDQKALLQRELEVHKQLIELSPNDSGIIYSYARSVEAVNGKAAAVPLLRQVVALNPNHDQARYVLGLCLIQLDQKEQGISELRTAFERTTDSALSVRIAHDLSDTLRILGRNKEANLVLDKLRRRQDSSR